MIFVLLFLLFVKHWYIDFVNQSIEEVLSKGKYGESVGMQHSIKHGVATGIVVLLFSNVFLAIVIGLFEALTHYHIDWCKSNYGCSDIKEKQFWTDLGLDQLAHSLTYLLIAYVILH